MATMLFEIHNIAAPQDRTLMCTKESLVDAVNECDKLISYRTGHNSKFLSDLNDMQREHYMVMTQAGHRDDDTVFVSKYTIPIYFLNLILHKYKLKLEPHVINNQMKEEL